MPRRRRVRAGARRRRVLPSRRLRLNRPVRPSAAPAEFLSRFSGSVYRQTGLDTPAFPPGRPAPLAGRYHRAGEPWPLYAALDPPTAWAEWRAATRGAIAGGDELRRLWRLRVRDLVVLDLRRPEVRAAMGLGEADLVGARDRPQRLAARARRLGAGGIVAPSAAQRGGFALVVFPSAFGAVRVTGSAEAHPDQAG